MSSGETVAVPAEVGPEAGMAKDPGRVSGLDPGEDPGRLARVLLFALVAVPMTVNAIALLPELTSGAPNLNDGAVHLLLVRDALRALSTGGSVLDFWMSQVELGFPQFLYYQQLPHLVVAGLDRLLLGAVDPVRVFDLVRYVLLVGLPVTVFWSLRRMGFSLAAAAVAAAAASLLSGGVRFGFEYDSYVWRGLGMFTQLWAMHLSFISLACVYRVLQRGTGYLPAILALTALVLCHLVYAYMMAITLLVVLVVGSRPRTFLPRLVRLTPVAAFAVAATAYMWLPFLRTSQYLNESPYLEPWRFDSFGAPTILRWLLSGDLLDHGRLPVLTALLAVGIVAALLVRTRLSMIALAGFVTWLVLYFGRPTLGAIVDLLPLHDQLVFHRFVGGVDMFAIILMGVGGAAVWGLAARIRRPWYPIVAFSATLLLLAPAVVERVGYYADNATWIQQTRAAYDGDADLRAILDTLAAQPGGRAYAGLRTGWGQQMLVGPYAHVADIFTFEAIDAVSPPYYSNSLNSDLIWSFNDGVEAQYDLFDIRYVVVPSDFTVPAFYEPMRSEGRWALYRIPTSGIAEFVAITERRAAPSQKALFEGNLAWFRGPGPAAREMIRWDFMQPLGPPAPSGGCPEGGSTEYERVEMGAVHLVVDCPSDSTLAIKVTYHPNWKVTVDGQRVETYMVSPSFIGIDIPAGRHQVDATYEATPEKAPLLIVGIAVLVAAAVLRRRLDLPAIWVAHRGVP